MGNHSFGSASAVTLRRWQVMEVVTRHGLRTRHLLGHDTASDEGRVSSPVVDFKLETMTATTSSGARYRLAGVPAHSRKVQSMWHDWCKANAVSAQYDVTNDYMDPDDMSTRQFVALNVSAFTTRAE
jgi:hypothetical protein